MKPYIIPILLMGLFFQITELHAQNLLDESESFSIGTGYADLINNEAFLSYGSFAFYNQYTKHYKHFQLSCRASFLISANFQPLDINDTLSIEKWRSYSTQSLQIPITYTSTGKVVNFSIGVGPTFRHRVSVVPNLNFNDLSDIEYKHTFDYGYLIQVSSKVLIKKSIYWNPYFYYYRYNAGLHVLGLNMGIGYIF